MQTPWLRSIALGATLIALAIVPACSCSDDDDTTPSGTSNPSGECGDGTVDDGEACDDGNTDDGDGCSASCQNEGAGICGDGNTDDDEECDDGNTDDGDGCSATCTNETGPMCGNGIPEEGEACDDGNPDSYDGCEPDCTESPEEVVCETLTPLASGTCEVIPGSGTDQIIYGDVLAPFTIFRGGQVLIASTGLISCVGCDCDAMATNPTEIRCPTGIVSPGLIDAHEHITYIQNDPYTDTGERYEHRNDWGRGDNGHTEITGYSGSATANEKHWGELRHLIGGATAIIGSGDVDGLLRNLDTDLQEGLGQPEVQYETFPIAGNQTDYGCSYSSITSGASISSLSAYFPHISEGISLSARNEFVCTEGTAFGSEDLLEPQTAYIHAVGLEPIDYVRMADQGTALIWSPRSNITLYGDTAVVTAAARLGVQIALGTDWVPTGSMNMQRELQCADTYNQTYLDGFFTDRDLWRMVTINAAGSAAVDDALGRLAAGLVADIAIFDGAAHPDYRAVIDADPQDTALVIRGGDVLFGDDAVVQALRPSDACETFNVCGTDKGICADADFGTTYADLVTDLVPGIYELFFCAPFPVTADEPTCTPMRAEEPIDGSSVYDGVPTATDGDGDGILDSSDNCPKVFNPIRPMDLGEQGDFDQDGAGDACDVCPMQPNGVPPCAAFDVNDIDQDGIPNATDNCPDVFNDGQVDADDDQRGDICDLCPDVQNPAPEACPVSIYSIKSGSVSGTVGVNNALVTGCKSGTGFYVQVHPDDIGAPGPYVGPENSGVFTYFPSVVCGTTLKVGNRVNINPASAGDFHGQIQLSDAFVTVVNSSVEAPPDPVDKLPSDIGGNVANEFESVLVRVQNVLVTDIAPPPGTADTLPTNEFVVANALRVNDLFYLINPLPALNTNYGEIVGIVDYRNDNMKLEPRGASDVTEGPPVMVSFGPSLTYLHEGDTDADTIPTALTVTMSKAVATPTDIDLEVTAGDPTDIGLPPLDKVTIPALASSITVPLDGLAPGTVTITATTAGSSPLTADVRVVGTTELPQVDHIQPAAVNVGPLGMATITVFLDIPAPGALGEDVNLALTPGSLGTLTPGTTINVAQDELSATVTFTAGASAGTATLDASTVSVPGTIASADIEVIIGSGLVINEVDYDNIDADDAEFIEIYNGTAAPFDLTDLTVVLVNGNAMMGMSQDEYDRIDLPPITLEPFQYLVIGSTTVLLAVPMGTPTILLPGSIQNGGAPSNPCDGIAIFDVGDEVVVDALSYDGDVQITMANITNAAGQFNFLEGSPTTLLDSNTVQRSLIRSPNGADSDNASLDWAITATPSPGAANP